MHQWNAPVPAEMAARQRKRAGSRARRTLGPHPFPCRNTVLKLHQDSNSALNTITSYGDGFVAVNLERHEGSVIIMPDTPVTSWPVSSFEDLAPEHFDALVAAEPEVVIFGSGSRLRFPHPRLTAQLARHRIGVETMDFGAACRTYNILMSEGRRVAVALLIEA